MMIKRFLHLEIEYNDLVSVIVHAEDLEDGHRQAGVSGFSRDTWVEE